MTAAVALLWAVIAAAAAPSTPAGPPAGPEAGPEAGEPAHRVLLLPTWTLLPDDGVTPPAVDAGVARGVRVRPDLTPVPPEALRAAIVAERTYADRIALARELAEEGVGAYERMRLDDAIRRLEKAVSLFERTHHRWVGRDDVAEARLTLALAFLEAGIRDKAHLAFKALLRIDPQRDLPKGWYSPAAIQAFQVARADFETAQDHPVGPAEETQLARLVGARYVLDAHLRRRVRGASALVVSLYDAGRDRVLDRVTVPADPATAGWRAERLASRLLACVSPYDGGEEAAVDPFPDGRWRLGVAVGGDVYLRRPARERSVNAGLVVGGDFLVRPHLAAMARVGLSTTTGVRLSVTDYEDMRTPLDTAALLLAIGPRLAGDAAALQLGVGLEALAPTAVRHTRDAGCKWGGGYVCRVRTDDPGLLLGPAVTVSASRPLLGPVRLTVEAAAAWYIVALRANALNAPVRASAGLSYAF